MRRLDKILALLFLLAAPLVCGGQARPASGSLELSKTYRIPGMDRHDICEYCYNHWDLNVDGLDSDFISDEFLSWHLDFTRENIRVDGTDVSLGGYVSISFRDGEIVVAFHPTRWKAGRMKPWVGFRSYPIPRHIRREFKKFQHYAYAAAGMVFSELDGHLSRMAEDMSGMRMESLQ